MVLMLVQAEDATFGENMQHAIADHTPLLQLALQNKNFVHEHRSSDACFRHFVNHTTDAFFMFDHNAIIVDVSRRATEYLGYTREELIGVSPIEVLSVYELSSFSKSDKRAQGR